MGSFLSILFSGLGLMQRSMSVIVVGLDNAGKTTLLGRIKSNTISSTLPTESATMEEFYLNGINFKAWDLGGHEVRCG